MPPAGERVHHWRSDPQGRSGWPGGGAAGQSSHMPALAGREGANTCADPQNGRGCLQVYPRSVAMMQLMVGIQRRAFMMSQLRLRLGMACEANPSVPLWLLAAKLEASQVLAHHRMQARRLAMTLHSRVGAGMHMLHDAS